MFSQISVGLVCPKCRSTNIRMVGNTKICALCRNPIKEGVSTQNHKQSYGEEWRSININAAVKIKHAKVKDSEYEEEKVEDDEHRYARMAKHLEENWMLYVQIFQKKLRLSSEKLRDLFRLDDRIVKQIKLLWKQYLLAWNKSLRPIISKFTIPLPGHYSTVKKSLHIAKTNLKTLIKYDEELIEKIESEIQPSKTKIDYSKIFSLDEELLNPQDDYLNDEKEAQRKIEAELHLHEMSYFKKSKRKLKINKKSNFEAILIPGQNLSNSRRSRRSSVIKTANIDLELECLYELEELCYSNTKNKKIQSDDFWKKLILSEDLLVRIIHLEYLVKIYCNSFQYKVKGDFLRKSLHRCNSRYFGNLKSELKRRIVFESDMLDEIFYNENTMLAHLSFFHACIFGADFYCYIKENNQLILDNHKIQKPIKFEILLTHYKELYDLSALNEYLYETLSKFSEIKTVLKYQEQVIEKHENTIEKIFEHDIEKKNVCTLETSLIYVIMYIALKLINFPIAGDDFRRLYAKGIYPFFQDESNKEEFSYLFDKNDSNFTELKSFQLEVKKPPCGQTLKTKQYEFIKFAFEDEANFFGFRSQIFGVINNGNRELYDFCIYEKIYYDLRYYHNLQLRTCHDLIYDSTTNQEIPKIQKCFENLFLGMISNAEGRKLLNKLEDQAIYGLLISILKILFGIGNKTPSLFTIKSEQIEKEKCKLAKTDKDLFDNLWKKASLKNCDEQIQKTRELQEFEDKLLLNWNNLMQSEKHGEKWLKDFLGNENSSDSIFRDEIKIPIEYNDVNKMTLEQMKYYIEVKSKDIQNAHSDPNLNKDHTQGANFSEFTFFNDKKASNGSTKNNILKIVKNQYENSTDIDYDNDLKDNLEEEIEFIKETLSKGQFLKDIELPHPSDEFCFYKNYMVTPKFVFCKRYLFLLDVFTAYSGLSLQVIIQSCNQVESFLIDKFSHK